MNGAVATVTVKIRNSTDSITLYRESVAKDVATDTGITILLPPLLTIANKAYAVQVLSSNASDTAVAWQCDWLDAGFIAANVTQWLGTAPLALASQRVQADATALNGSTLAAQVLAATLHSYRDDAVVLVADGATDAARGTNLATAYTAAAALTPGGNALSATNRAVVLIPPGMYARSTALAMSAEFVDLIALVPAAGKATELTLQPTVRIYSTSATAHAINQTAADVRLRGLETDATQYNDNYAGLYIDHGGEGTSIYEDMKLCGSKATMHSSIVDGTWRNCQAEIYAWRVAAGGIFCAEMYDCRAGVYSYGGDDENHTGRGATFQNSWIERCIGGDYCFGGCTTFGIPSTSTAWFLDVTGGNKCFSIGGVCAGNYIRCRGGTLCCGATALDDNYPGEFSGYAEDCIFGAGSCGGRDSLTRTTGKCTGTLLRTTIRNGIVPTHLEGATIDDCLFTISSGYTDPDIFTLDDSNSRIHNSTLLVVQGGVGVPINAAAAKNVSAIGNRYNNVGVSATGLGANVTNVGTGELNKATWTDAKAGMIGATGVTVANVDGITHESAMELLLAVLSGVATVDTSTPSAPVVTYKKRNGTTSKVTITYSAATGVRTASTIV
jgi:hypothetical protein